MYKHGSFKALLKSYNKYIKYKESSSYRFQFLRH